MQVQVPTHEWNHALVHLPNGGCVMAIDNWGVLEEAKAANPFLFTVHRHFFARQDFSSNYPMAVEIAEAAIKTWANPSYLRVAHLVDCNLEFNEYYDTGMALNDPATLEARLVTMAAHANVWNDKYRGRTLVIDGVEGTIPASCRMGLGNSPVGNEIPERAADIAAATDNYLCYHPYMHASVRVFPNTIRDPGDWRWHSGRWHFMEQGWRRKPKWLFTEMMPYMGSYEGWRHWVCLDGDEDLLVRLYGEWLDDVITTPAFKEGRIAGWTGAWYVTSTDLAWDKYWLEKPQLIRLADKAREYPQPGVEVPPMATTPETIREALAFLDQARAKLAPLANYHTLANLTNQLVFDLFRRAFTTEHYWNIVVANCDETAMLANRQGPYRGLSIEEMPALNASQRAQLIAAIV